MPRPIWTGSVSFGLVNVPVRLFSAVRPLTRMLFGRSQRFDDSARTFAVAGPELG